LTSIDVLYRLPHMVEMTYTLDELEAETGFSKRTIRNYIQNIIGTGHAIGRRNARYPQIVLDKLMFVRKVRDTNSNLGLADFRAIIEATPDDDIARVADGKEPLEIADVRTAEGVREFEIRAKTGNRRQKVVAVTLEGPVPKAPGRQRPKFSKKPIVPGETRDNWKTIKLGKDVELRLRGEYPSSKLKQLKLLGELVKSILSGK